MAQHTYPAKRTDDIEFPIRIKFLVPPCGLGGTLDEMNAWLREHTGARSAHHSAASNAGHAIGVYFRTLAEAVAFTAAFPQLVLADGVGERVLRTAEHHILRS